MAYIGNIPADKYQTLQKQSFTTSATDTYTLSYAVTNPQDLALFINNVRQNPNDAYTVSGTTLTLSSAITGSDTMYAIFLGKAVETVAPALSSVTNDMLAGSIANSKLANSSITLNGSAVSLGGSATVGGTNTPAFEGKNNTNQSMSNNTYTKVTFGTENLDTDSCFASSRFTPTTSGKYFIYSTLTIQCGSNVGHAGHIQIRKNGSAIFLSQSNDYPNTTLNIFSVSASAIVSLNGSSDYVEIYGLGENSSGTPTLLGDANGSCIFGGYKIIE
jgi:hypothetical protein